MMIPFCTAWKSSSTGSYWKLPVLPGNITSISLAEIHNAGTGNYSGDIHFKSSKQNGNTDTGDIKKLSGVNGTSESFTFDLANNETYTTGYIAVSAGFRLKSVSVTFKKERYTYNSNPSTASCGADLTVGDASLKGTLNNVTSVAVTAATSAAGSNCEWTDYGFIWST